MLSSAARRAPNTIRKVPVKCCYPGCTVTIMRQAARANQINYCPEHRAAAERPARTKRAKLRGAGPEQLELSERHLDVLRLAADGMTDIQIGQALHISVGTVASHMTAIYARMGAHNRAHAVAIGFRRRLLTIPPASPFPAVVFPAVAEKESADMAAAGWKRRSNGEYVPARNRKTDTD